MTATDSVLSSLLLRLGSMRASSMDVCAVLESTCAGLPGMLGITGAVVVLHGPLETSGAVCFASDDRARWVGELQRRSASGPLPNALRAGRPLLTDDLTRVGPPEVAAAAAQSGLVSSIALPLQADGIRVGGVQLLGDVEHPVGPGHAEAVRPLMEVLSARLVDLRELRRLHAAIGTAVGPAGVTADPGSRVRRTPAKPAPADLPGTATTAVPMIRPMTPRPRPSPELGPLPRLSFPLQRPGRHGS